MELIQHQLGLLLTLTIKQAQSVENPNTISQQLKVLTPFASNPRKDMPDGIPMRLTDYLELVDWTGRILRDDKREGIPEHLPPLLQRLNIDAEHWLYMTQHFESRFKHLVGAVHRLKQVCRILGYERTVGLGACKSLLPDL